jgi:hypothetical protein
MKNANRQMQIRSSWLNDFAPVKLMVASLAVLAATVIPSLAQSASYDANVKLILLCYVGSNPRERTPFSKQRVLP